MLNLHTITYVHFDTLTTLGPYFLILVMFNACNSHYFLVITKIIELYSVHKLLKLSKNVCWLSVSVEQLLDASKSLLLALTTYIRGFVYGK